MADFAEVSDRIWVARYPWYDVNVTVVAGGDGLLVVDTHGSAAAAREVLDDVRRLAARLARGPGTDAVIGIVNTHAHFDHCFGNGTFRAAAPGVPLYAHEAAAAAMVPDSARWLSMFAPGGPEGTDPHAADVLDTEVVPADVTFSSALVVDLGDRQVELVHPGRGHSDGDLVVRVPDARTLLAGDLVEQSGPPVFGPDSFPMEWPLSLDIVLGLVTSDWVVVPGHGAPVDRDFVEEQRNTLGIVAETVRDLASRGVALEDALQEAEWPYPRAALADAVRRGYEQLPRAQKRLPLV